MAIFSRKSSVPFILSEAPCVPDIFSFSASLALSFSCIPSADGDFPELSTGFSFFPAASAPEHSSSPLKSTQHPLNFFFSSSRSLSLSVPSWSILFTKRNVGILYCVSSLHNVCVCPCTPSAPLITRIA